VAPPSYQSTLTALSAETAEQREEAFHRELGEIGLEEYHAGLVDQFGVRTVQDLWDCSADELDQVAAVRSPGGSAMKSVDRMRLTQAWAERRVVAAALLLKPLMPAVREHLRPSTEEAADHDTEAARQLAAAFLRKAKKASAGATAAGTAETLSEAWRNPSQAETDAWQRLNKGLELMRQDKQAGTIAEMEKLFETKFSDAKRDAWADVNAEKERKAMRLLARATKSAEMDEYSKAVELCNRILAINFEEPALPNPLQRPGAPVIASPAIEQLRAQALELRAASAETIQRQQDEHDRHRQVLANQQAMAVLETGAADTAQLAEAVKALRKVRKVAFWSSELPGCEHTNAALHKRLQKQEREVRKRQEREAREEAVNESAERELLAGQAFLARREHDHAQRHFAVGLAMGLFEAGRRPKPIRKELREALEAAQQQAKQSKVERADLARQEVAQRLRANADREKLESIQKLAEYKLKAGRAAAEKGDMDLASQLFDNGVQIATSAAGMETLVHTVEQAKLECIAADTRSKQAQLMKEGKQASKKGDLAQAIQRFEAGLKLPAVAAELGGDSFSRATFGSALAAVQRTQRDAEAAEADVQARRRLGHEQQKSAREAAAIAIKRRKEQFESTHAAGKQALADADYGLAIEIFEAGLEVS
jgi:hypothetical protein